MQSDLNLLVKLQESWDKAMALTGKSANQCWNNV